MAVKKKAVAKKKATHRMPNGMMMEGAFHGAKEYGSVKGKKVHEGKESVSKKKMERKTGKS